MHSRHVFGEISLLGLTLPSGNNRKYKNINYVCSAERCGVGNCGAKNGEYRGPQGRALAELWPPKARGGTYRSLGATRRSGSANGGSPIRENEPGLDLGA